LIMTWCPDKRAVNTSVNLSTEKAAASSIQYMLVPASASDAARRRYRGATVMAHQWLAARRRATRLAATAGAATRRMLSNTTHDCAVSTITSTEPGPTMTARPRKFAKEFVTAACGNNNHDICEHLSGIGGGFSLRRLSFEVSSLLCHCTCHASCQLSTSRRPTLSDWFDLCSCPGANTPARERAGRPPDAAEVMRKAREDLRLRQEASEAVRANSAGKSREEVRALLVAELRAHGLPPPPQPVMELAIDGLMIDRSATGRVRLAGRGMRMLAGIGRQLSKDVHEQLQRGGPNLILEKEPILLDSDRSRPAIEVQLDPEAWTWLAPAGGLERFPDTDGSEIYVLLKAEGPSAGAGPVAVYAADHRVGVLGPTAAYNAALDAGKQSNQPVVAEAVRRRSPDGAWHLYVYPPAKSSRA
jgi:hypothetical protein